MIDDKIKCYELDFGDTNLITPNKDEIIEWIKNDLEDINDNGLHYTITVRMMTSDEINSLPEWN